MTNDRKTYNRIKLTLGFTEAVLSFGFLVTLVLTAGSRLLQNLAEVVSTNPFVQFMAFTVLVGLANGFLTFPLSFYKSYTLEHRYNLSNQTIVKWILERLKGLALGAIIGLPLLLLFYYLFNRFGQNWWLPVGAMILFVSVILARLVPTLIFPLFYDFKPLNNPPLKEKLLELCTAAKLPIAGVFEFNLSKTTKKANAAFAGIGRSKRILLGDTLLQNFQPDEIEIVFAHEIGHYVYRHIFKGILLSIVTTFLGLFVTAMGYEWLTRQMGLVPLELAALPMLAILLSIYGLVTTPLNNIISRSYERQADTYALQTTGKKDAFVTAMKRLSDTNLADEDPHPLVEFLFYSHPSIGKRIATANLT